MAAKITYTIQDVLGDLSVAANGWKKELTYTSWTTGTRSLTFALGTRTIQL